MPSDTGPAKNSTFGGSFQGEQSFPRSETSFALSTQTYIDLRIETVRAELGGIQRELRSEIEGTRTEIRQLPKYWQMFATIAGATVVGIGAIAGLYAIAGDRMSNGFDAASAYTDLISTNRADFDERFDRLERLVQGMAEQQAEQSGGQQDENPEAGAGSEQAP